jgi:riboflavin kinase / FMN adenylyltransferase
MRRISGEIVMSKLIRDLPNVQPHHRGCVATIGNFDGVHLGHRVVLRQLAAKAAELQCPSLIITFEPLPEEFFAPERAPARLTRLREKLEILCQYTVDWVLCLRFNRQLASMEAEEFIRTVLVERLGIRYLVAGDDFRFGRGRRGDFPLLERTGTRYGFGVARMHTFFLDGERVSSTRIRRALAEGDLAEGEKLLGRPYSMSGRVVSGDKRGRTLGFPTANINLHRHKPALEGVFAVEIHGLGMSPLPGAANLGVRPTIGGRRALLEVHILDFDGDIYGRYVQVSFLQRLRPERHFKSLEALRQQMEKDCAAARYFFATRQR